MKYKQFTAEVWFSAAAAAIASVALITGIFNHLDIKHQRDLREHLGESLAKANDAIERNNKDIAELEAYNLVTEARNELPGRCSAFFYDKIKEGVYVDAKIRYARVDSREPYEVACFATYKKSWSYDHDGVYLSGKRVSLDTLRAFEKGLNSGEER